MPGVEDVVGVLEGGGRRVAGSTLEEGEGDGEGRKVNERGGWLAVIALMVLSRTMGCISTPRGCYNTQSISIYSNYSEHSTKTRRRTYRITNIDNLPF